jgi:hypothetical protein
VSAPRGEDGIPRRSERLSALRGAKPKDESWLGANEAKSEKLQRNTLDRRARAQGLELRHSAYGYALLDRARNRIDDRSDLTLAEVESRLAER